MGFFVFRLAHLCQKSRLATNYPRYSTVCCCTHRLQNPRSDNIARHANRILRLWFPPRSWGEPPQLRGGCHWSFPRVDMPGVLTTDDLSNFRRNETPPMTISESSF